MNGKDDEIRSGLVIQPTARRTRLLDALKHLCYAERMNHLLSIVIICLGVLLTLIGDIYLKSGLEDGRLLLIGIAFYAVEVIPVAVAFTRIQFGAVFLIWEVLTVVMALVVAKVWFGEPLSTSKAAALVLALAALSLSTR